MSRLPPRKHMPVSVQRDACLHVLGLLGEAINWDHSPPLAMREQVKDDAGNIIGYVPDENDPRYIVPMLADAHKLKTNGKPHDHSNGDKTRIAHARELSRKQEEFRAAILRKTSPDTPQPERVKFKRKIASRPFGKRNFQSNREYTR